MSSPSSPEIIVYSYEMAPNPQKLFQMLSLLRLPFKYVVIPVTMPRPQLATLGITYRRTPLLSIGSDMYADTALIVSKLCDMASHSATDTGLADTTNHLEYDGLGQLAFQVATAIIPRDWPLLQDKAFLADRSELTGRTFDPELLAKIRPTMISKMLSLVSLVEKNFLRDGRKFFLGGSTPTTADIHLYWALNWGLRYHEGARPEVSKSSHPKIFGWLEHVEGFLKDRRIETKIDIAEAEKILLAPPTHEYAKFVPHVADNPEGLSQGQRVKVTPADSGRTGPQYGSLISLNYEQVCLRNDEGLVMHFPRFGYEIVSAEDGGKL
jgi:glutathione S-transferase